MDENIIKLAFQTYDALDSDCTGLDIVKDPKTNKPVILEISYGFSHQAQIGAGGYLIGIAIGMILHLIHQKLYLKIY